ncbi:16S rRNA (guanine(527)-N(7))-methyltransferase RsmG [Maricaulaceae bacterium NA33B04]|nr:16S rRNA (guanine(527)-N(7))-methyltransferase RsmG [Maricaulaceae bacterium NA33B04]
MSEMTYGAVEFARDTGVSRETLRRFEVWRDLLADTNSHTNLVGRSTLSDFWFRHALDSWQVFNQGKGAGRWADLGSGAGFPGLAVAFGLMESAQPDSHVFLVESIGKKSRFLNEVVAATGAPVTVYPVRVEAMADVPRVDVVTARAMAPLTKLFGYVHPFVEKGATCLLPKGRNFKEELTEARKSWTFEEQVIPSLTSSEAVLLKIRDLRRA